jgi:hypothetical protein
MVLCVQYDEKFEADLAQGEPDPQILTVLRALTVSVLPLRHSFSLSMLIRARLRRSTIDSFDKL